MPTHSSLSPYRRHPHRRRRLNQAALIFSALLLTACAPEPTGEAAATSTGGFPITIEHIAGTTQIPAEPQRVVVLDDYVALDDVVALGVTPVAYGYTDAWGTGLSPWQLEAGLGQIEQLEASEGASLEAVAAQTPDLLIGMEWPLTERFDELSSIAPTVGVSWSAPWRDTVRLLGTTLGRQDRADELVAEVEADIAASAERLAELQSVTIMVGSAYSDVLYLQGDASPLVQLLRELGLTVATTTDAALDELSLEQIGALADADVLLSLATDLDATSALQEQELFQSLPAVASGSYTAIGAVEARSLTDSFGPLSSDFALAAIEEILLSAAAGQGSPLG